ncbi:MAG: class I SAM-dependent methyltransferase [Caldilineaceae bacterium]
MRHRQRHAPDRPANRPQGQLTALDLNAEMLKAARTYVKPTAPPIRWLHADVVEMPVADGDVDVVLCQQSFNSSPISWALQEMRRAAGARRTAGLQHLAWPDTQSLYPER